MKIRHYIIARHGVAVQFDDDCDAELLPSSAPFEVEEGKDELLRIEVTREPLTEEWDEEIGQFDCGGACFGVYRMADGGYMYDVRDIDGTLCCRLRANDDFTYGRVQLIETSARRANYGLNNAYMLMYAFATAPYQTLLMHSSVVSWGGKGYMFLGKSGTGKSTHTSLWLKYIAGSELMNDDNPVLRVVDGVPCVFGSPWSGKTPCYRNVWAPIGGIVNLQQRPYNSIARESVLGSMAALLPSASTMKWDKRIHSAVVGTMAAAIEATPIYTLGCLPDEGAAQLSHSTLCNKQ